jgi:hypothetical protein
MVAKHMKRIICQIGVKWGVPENILMLNPPRFLMTNVVPDTTVAAKKHDRYTVVMDPPPKRLWLEFWNQLHVIVLCIGM